MSIKCCKAFTLVEILVVVIIIGILAGIMMLAAGAAIDKAEATKIVNNLMTLKTASVLAHADTGKWYYSTGYLSNKNAAAATLNHYAGMSLSLDDNCPYAIYYMDSSRADSADIYATFDTTTLGSKQDGIIKALVKMAQNGVPLIECLASGRATKTPPESYKGKSGGIGVVIHNAGK